jgi:probable rRNA maturation factor
MTQLRRMARALLCELCLGPGSELGIYLVGDKEMTRLNEGFLRHRGSTDVITFDYSETPVRTTIRPPELHGEVLVCLDEAIRQARRFHTSWQSELTRYIIHGLLHLCGYSDHTKARRRLMKQAENRLLRQLATQFPLARIEK